ncbi:hypothetical protein MNBD_PLANCTO02-1236 [hydrothermal vent metagenome]|uniref:Cytochrome P460 domain-containing protein n=1 Tax=hydrothermal vent metagenome TaxID=652676 RepID=A0A3B1DUI8_9ZZZZ
MLPNKKVLFVLIAGLGAILTWVVLPASTVEAQSGSRTRGRGSNMKGSGSSNRGRGMQGSGTRGSGTVVQKETFEDNLWKYLKSAKYTNWAPVPGKKESAYKGQSPHGAFLKMYLNRKAAGNFKTLPSGSIIVKENYGKDAKTLMAITVMYRNKGYDPQNGDWYWVKYNPDGSVANAPQEKGGMRLAGKVKGCIQCHSGAEGKDYFFAND